MSVEKVRPSQTKTIKIICDRCRQLIEGIRGSGFTAGIYDMAKWEEFRRNDEKYVCASCMFADQKYTDRYGSCF